ncbi:MAG TPA: RodZ domain-containing protein [Methylomirabilota bacterium]|nr:RodZ domain-containing protein [Methylomirabilota bacterium]
MSSLGIRLRELREAKGVSLDNIARSTRVGRGHLEALESDRLDELPSPVFVKGFIRAYCEFLDASPDEALGLYREAAGKTVKPERVQSATLTKPSRRVGPLMVSLVLFIALGASLFALRMGLKSSPRPAPAVSGPARGNPESVASSTPAPATSSTAVRVQPAPVPAGEPRPAGQRLLIRAVEPTWIRVQVDEGQVTKELLQAGAVREWTAARRFVLTVGNAGGLEVDLNGRRIPALGARGAVIQRLVLPAEAQRAGS